MKKQTEITGKPVAVKTIEMIIDLADAFAEASMEKQAEALRILDQEFKNEKNGTSRDWHTLFANTFRFTANRKGAKITLMNEIPIIEAKTDGNGLTVSFYCRHCRVKHTHGASVAGHRQAHCADESSPYKSTGYILKISEKTGAKRK